MKTLLEISEQIIQTLVVKYENEVFFDASDMDHATARKVAFDHGLFCVFCKVTSTYAMRFFRFPDDVAQSNIFTVIRNI